MCPDRRRSHARHDERGSVLLLMPAAVLVMIVLGAIAVDAAVLFLGERELAAATAAAANDAAVAALQRDSFYRCGTLRLDGTAAETVAAAVVSGRSSDAVAVDSLDVQVDNAAAEPTVTVEASGSVDLIFAPALPGAAAVGRVDARSVAVARWLGPAATATC